MAHLPKFNPDLPTLEGEEIDDGFEERKREDLSFDLALLEPVQRMVSDPMWTTLGDYLETLEHGYIEQMLNTRDAAQTLEWRARVGLVRELRALPEVTAAKVEALRQALEEDDGE